MKFKDEIELTPEQKLLGNVIAGLYLVACGVVLLLVGLGVFGSVTVGSMWLPTVLLTLGLIFFTTGLIQGNVVSVWLACAFMVPAAISYLANFTPLTYARLYPFYVATPAICSLVTAALSRRAVKEHLKVGCFFGIIAAALALKSFGVCGWSVALPVIVVFIGIVIIFSAVKRNKENEE